MMEEREKRDWRKTKKHHRIKEGKMRKWMGTKKKDVQRERWIIVSQIVKTAVICLGAAKSHLCCLELLPPVHSAGGSSTCSEVYKGGGWSTRWSRDVNRRKSEGLCEVGGKQVGSSSAADCGLCLQEICWNLPLPASQPASQGSCEGINQNFIQASPDTSTMSQSSKNKNYSWGNKVSPETCSFSMETIYVIDQLWKEGGGGGNPFLIWFSIFFMGISMVWGANFTREKILLHGK